MYDGDGNRVKKTPQDGTATEYFYADGTLYKEKFGTDNILYYRDEDGEICSFMLNFAPYILRKNAQGDVIALCDSKGAVVARYVYDAWGNHKVLNPDGTEKYFGRVYRKCQSDSLPGVLLRQRSRFVLAQNPVLRSADG